MEVKIARKSATMHCRIGTGKGLFNIVDASPPSGPLKRARSPSFQNSTIVLDLTHIIWVILKSNRPSALFDSPIGENGHNVLDIETGDGCWAMDVGDTFPNISSVIPQGLIC